MKSIKYIAPIFFYVVALFSFYQNGIWAWSLILFGFGVLPIMELILPVNSDNMSKAEEDLAKKNTLYDLLIYFVVPCQFVALYLFLNNITTLALLSNEGLANMATMGFLCGVFGINVGHELGHRLQLFERNMAKSLLLTSLYMHFYVEHNKGHHKNVATHEDPSSSRYNENLYAFLPRTIINSYKSAWHISFDEMKKKNVPNFHWSNQMLQFQILQIMFCLVIFWVWGFVAFMGFLVAAFIGILLLEAVNYIEHYGLERKLMPSGYFERTLPQHSWNSDHVLGRLMLFELTRHSDHHYLASRKFQILRSIDQAPQLPTGYPGSIILSLVPPLWFKVMNKKIADYKQALG